jgi:hypothetical protein
VREHARQADAGHVHHSASHATGWRERLTSRAAWSDVAHNFRGDWQMLYREVAVGFLLAGFIAQLGNGVFRALFIRHAPAALRTLENVVVGPLIAVASFVCSVGNVPLAAVRGQAESASPASWPSSSPTSSSCPSSRSIASTTARPLPGGSPCSCSSPWPSPDSWSAPRSAPSG